MIAAVSRSTRPRRHTGPGRPPEEVRNAAVLALLAAGFGPATVARLSANEVLFSERAERIVVRRHLTDRRVEETTLDHEESTALVLYLSEARCYGEAQPLFLGPDGDSLTAGAVRAIVRREKRRS